MMENAAIIQGCPWVIALSVLSIARRTQSGPGESPDKVIIESLHQIFSHEGGDL